MYYKSKLLYQIIKEHKLINRMKVNLQLLESISIGQKIEVKDLIFILGISKNGLWR